MGKSKETSLISIADLAEGRQWRIFRRRIREDYRASRRSRVRLGEADMSTPDPHQVVDHEGEHYNDNLKKKVHLPPVLASRVVASNLAHAAAHKPETNEPKTTVNVHDVNAKRSAEAAVHAHKLGFVDLANTLAARNGYARKTKEKLSAPKAEPNNPGIFKRAPEGQPKGEGIEMSLRAHVRALHETVRILREFRELESYLAEAGGVPGLDSPKKAPRPDAVKKNGISSPTAAPRPAPTPEKVGPAQHLQNFHSALKKHGDVSHPEVQAHLKAAKQALGQHAQTLQAKGDKKALKGVMGIQNKLHGMSKKPSAPKPQGESVRHKVKKSLGERVAKLRKSLGK